MIMHKSGLACCN